MLSFFPVSYLVQALYIVKFTLHNLKYWYWYIGVCYQVIDPSAIPSLGAAAPPGNLSSFIPHVLTVLMMAVLLFASLGSGMAQYEANADFQGDYYKRRKLAMQVVSWELQQVSIICFPLC